MIDDGRIDGCVAVVVGQVRQRCLSDEKRGDPTNFPTFAFTLSRSLLFHSIFFPNISYPVKDMGP